MPPDGPGPVILKDTEWRLLSLEKQNLAIYGVFLALRVFPPSLAISFLLYRLLLILWLVKVVLLETSIPLDLGCLEELEVPFYQRVSHC